MVPLEIGTDIGGSIRSPAHFCGVYGHKTSYGVIPLDGHRFPGTDGADRPLSVAGPMAREAGDLALALDVVARDPLPRARIESLAGVRLFVLTSHPRAQVSQEIAAGIDAAAARAEAAGATIVRESDLLPDLSAIVDHYIPMLNMIISGGMPGPGGSAPTLLKWFGLCDAQARVERAFARFFESHDAILAPVFGTTAFAHDDEPDLRKRTLTIDGEETPFAEQFGWISMATFAGLPATSTPIGVAANGMPFNMQIIGARRRDHDMIALAGMLGR
jgi:amidase